MDSKLVLNSIIKKIIAGKSDWTLEELQYQKNNPQEIEVALVKERLKAPVQCKCKGIMIIPYSWNVSMQKQAKKYFHVRRFLFAPEAVALALYHNININEHVCIITDDTESIEIGIYNIGDGVFEAVSTHWILKNEQKKLPMVCDTMLRDLDLSGKIAQIIFARTTPYHINAHNLESVFQRPVLQVGNLTELCNIGVSVQQGISQGYVKDLLLLSVIPQAIGISDDDGSMLQIVQADTTIPTRKTETTYITDSMVLIRQGNNAIASHNPVISTLHFHNTGISQRRQIEITVDIDINGCCHICAKDTSSNETVWDE